MEGMEGQEGSSEELRPGLGALWGGKGLQGDTGARSRRGRGGAWLVLKLRPRAHPWQPRDSRDTEWPGSLGPARPASRLEREQEGPHLAWGKSLPRQLPRYSRPAHSCPRVGGLRAPGNLCAHSAHPHPPVCLGQAVGLPSPPSPCPHPQPPLKSQGSCGQRPGAAPRLDKPAR